MLTWNLIVCFYSESIRMMQSCVQCTVPTGIRCTAHAEMLKRVCTVTIASSWILLLSLTHTHTHAMTEGDKEIELTSCNLVSFPCHSTKCKLMCHRSGVFVPGSIRVDVNDIPSGWDIKFVFVTSVGSVLLRCHIVRVAFRCFALPQRHFTSPSPATFLNIYINLNVSDPIRRY